MLNNIAVTRMRVVRLLI